MTIQRMDNVLILVDDLEAAKSFFIELGLELEGETQVEGPSVDSLIGLKDVRATLALMRTPDGHGRIEPRRSRLGTATRPGGRSRWPTTGSSAPNLKPATPSLSSSSATATSLPSPPPLGRSTRPPGSSVRSSSTARSNRTRPSARGSASTPARSPATSAGTWLAPPCTPPPGSQGRRPAGRCLFRRPSGTLRRTPPSPIGGCSGSRGSVAVSRDTALVGAPLDDTARGTDAGSAWVFLVA